MAGGLPGMNAAVQDLRGQPSIDAVLAAMSPEEQAMVESGIDPFGSDMAPMGNLPAAPAPQLSRGQQIAGELSQYLGALNPQDPLEGAAGAKLLEAIQMLGSGGGQVLPGAAIAPQVGGM